MTSSGIEGVVARAAAGDAEAFASLVAEHGADVHRLCMVITTDRALAEEAAQNAWRQAWRRLNTLREPSSLRSWLMRVAANESKQVLRRSRRRRESSLDSARNVPRAAGDPQEHIALRDALRSLDPSDREILAQRYVLGWTSGEIGQHLGLTGTGVRARLKRIRTRLYLELSDDA
jgi:RNA polymerase sigma-70 factor, ECF subfamily